MVKLSFFTLFIMMPAAWKCQTTLTQVVLKLKSKLQCPLVGELLKKADECVSSANNTSTPLPTCVGR